MDELTIYRDLNNDLIKAAMSNDIALSSIALLNDRILTVLLCPKKDLSLYLTGEDKILRKLAELRIKNCSCDCEE
jgi:hypothetical protein